VSQSRYDPAANRGDRDSWLQVAVKAKAVSEVAFASVVAFANKWVVTSATMSLLEQSQLTMAG
jgi:Rad3-related DNA helicase